MDLKQSESIMNNLTEELETGHTNQTSHSGNAPSHLLILSRTIKLKYKKINRQQQWLPLTSIIYSTLTIYSALRHNTYYQNLKKKTTSISLHSHCTVQYFQLFHYYHFINIKKMLVRAAERY